MIALWFVEAIIKFPALTINEHNVMINSYALLINSARLLLKSFRELPCQFASVSRTQEKWLLLVISVIYLPSPKPRKWLSRYSILNAHCKHMILLLEKFFKAETACRVTAFVSEIFNLLIIGFYLLHICNSYRPNRLTDLLKFLYWYNIMQITKQIQLARTKKICLMKECKKKTSKWLLNQDYVR